MSWGTAAAATTTTTTTTATTADVAAAFAAMCMVAKLVQKFVWGRLQYQFC